jgi:N-methylhydantoinase B
VHIDPVTYEVIKHRLWQINDEQGITIRAMSTSPIVVEGNDMNVGLYTGDGELAVAGPYVLTHVTTMDAVIKHVIERSPDVQDGDMYLVNDPYLGALHQNDVAVVSPLFRDGELVMWVGNVVHHADLAGMDEGSFCINATNVFQEPPRYFLKLADRGVVSPEVERTFATNSRLPEMAALDLRAQIGAITVVRRRLHELLDQQPTATVVGVMRQMVDLAEEQLRARIAELPDGTWSADVYMDSDRVGSDRILRVHVRLDKRGDELFFDYTGSDPQSEGAVNATSYACYAGTTTPIYTFLCGGEIDWNSSIRRCVHVYAPEGTVMNARYPAAVSICSIGFTWLAADAAMRVVAQMLAESDNYKDRVCPSWGVACNANNIFGINERGQFVGGLLSDHRGGGAAARSFGDGFDHAGMIVSALNFMSNVESQEWKLPLVYVFRRQLADSGGPGMFRGGLTVLTALAPLHAERLTWKSQNTAGSDQSNAAGIRGGYPGAGSQVSVVRHARLWDQFRSGEIPLTFAALGGTVQHLPTKSEGVLEADDIFVFYPPGGGGFGDPLQREPQRVRQDVLNGAVSPAGARQHYGVVLTDGMAVDPDQTQQTRRSRIEDRRSHGPVAADSDADGPSPAGQVCWSCGAQASQWLRWTTPLADAGPWLALRWDGHSPNFALAHTACPSCGALVDVEERREDGR